MTYSYKALVRDRLLHHAIYRTLYPFFVKTFISDSFSCQKYKGTHKAIGRFRKYAFMASENNTKTCWILKCDIRKFFANIDHDILIGILKKYIPDEEIVWLLKTIIESFEVKPKKGLPLGNLTSQLLVNIYMNEFDQFVKHKLKVKYYIRYADDFVILSKNKECLEKILSNMECFLNNKLKLQLHPNKVSISTFASGVDFLGWVHFPNHKILRTATKRRMFKNLSDNYSNETIQSYLGLIKHGDTYKIQKEILKSYNPKTPLDLDQI